MSQINKQSICLEIIPKVYKHYILLISKWKKIYESGNKYEVYKIEDYYKYLIKDNWWIIVIFKKKKNNFTYIDA